MCMAGFLGSNFFHRLVQPTQNGTLLMVAPTGATP